MDLNNLLNALRKVSSNHQNKKNFGGLPGRIRRRIKRLCRRCPDEPMTRTNSYGEQFFYTPFEVNGRFLKCHVEMIDPELKDVRIKAGTQMVDENTFSDGNNRKLWGRWRDHLLAEKCMAMEQLCFPDGTPVTEKIWDAQPAEENVSHQDYEMMRQATPRKERSRNTLGG